MPRLVYMISARYASGEEGHKPFKVDEPITILFEPSSPSVGPKGFKRSKSGVAENTQRPSRLG